MDWIVLGLAICGFVAVCIMATTALDKAIGKDHDREDWND